MSVIRNLFVAVLAASAAVPALAQPQVDTPAGQPLIGAPTYTIPYAIGGRNEYGQLQETVVTVGNHATATTCGVQVEWRRWDGTLAGVSGPIAIPPEFTYEFTTVAAIIPPGLIAPFVTNVHSNLEDRFEGHAKVRTTCPATNKLRVNAQAVVMDANHRDERYLQIKVTRVPGNVGD